MSSDKKDDLTDITQLPDFDESEDDASFASLDEMAKDFGLESDDSPPDFPTPPSFNELPNVEAETESESDFSNDDSDFSEETDFSSENDFSEETDFSDENDFPEETDFSSENDFSEETDFSSENDFSEETDFSNENDFSEETDFSGDNDFSEESDFSNENDFSEENNFTDDNDISEEDDFTSENEASASNQFSNNSDNDSFTRSDDNTAPMPTESKTRAWEKIEQEMQLTSSASTSQLTPASDLSPTTDLEDKKTKTPINYSDVKTHQTPPEQFEEFKNFAQTMTFSNFSSEGNPPFSIILKNLHYVEDVEDIVEILLEFKIVMAEDKDSTIQILSRGQLLIPRLSEYAAIYLCHKLRRFDVEILMGLTEEISPPKSYTSNDRGLSSKRTIYANRRHNYNFENKNPVDEILVTTLPQAPDFKIIKYLGVITEDKILDAQDLARANMEDELIEHIAVDQQEELHLTRIKRENKLASFSQNKFNYQDFYNKEALPSRSKSVDYLYQDLIDKIKIKAKASHANAVVGINFSITPVSAEEYLKNGPQYQILCSGNMVWLERN